MAAITIEVPNSRFRGTAAVSAARATPARDDERARLRKVFPLLLWPLSSRPAPMSSGPELADEPHTSHDTVRTHVPSAMTKLGARSRAHLVAKALGDGLLLA